MNKVEEYNDNKSESGTSNSENVNDNRKRCKRNKLTKKQQFMRERNEIINELNNILGITEENKVIILYDIENSEEIKNNVKGLSTRIKKYFKSGNWNFYVKENNGEEALIIGLIRAVYRDEGWNMTKKDILITKNNTKIRTTKYYLIKE